MGGIFKISISQNTKCDILVGFPKSGHNYIGIRLSDEKFEALKSNCILPCTFKFPSKIEYGKH